MNFSADVHDVVVAVAQSWNSQAVLAGCRHLLSFFNGDLVAFVS